jgi:hypothetical protein
MFISSNKAELEDGEVIVFVGGGDAMRLQKRKIAVMCWREWMRLDGCNLGGSDMGRRSFSGDTQTDTHHTGGHTQLT